MKRLGIISGGLIAVVVVVIAIVPALRAEAHWQWVARQDSAAGYAAYLRAWPEGGRAVEAQRRWEERAWAAALSADTLDAYTAYLGDHSAGLYAAAARDRIEDLRWQEAVVTDAIAPLEAYLRDYDGGRYAGDAQRKIEDLTWLAANITATVQGFQSYLQGYADGRYVSEARAKIDALHWQTAERGNTIATYERYLAVEPGGAHIAEAQERIEAIHWAVLAGGNTIRAYRQYLERYPSGRYGEDAAARITALAADDAPFRAAAGQRTRRAYDTFLAEYPGHRREREVRMRIADLDGRDLVDLIAERKVNVSSQGAGLTGVQLTVTSTVEHDITVRVPAGTFFVAQRGSVQNMVATSQATSLVRGNQFSQLFVAAACANINRDIPSPDDRFTVQRSPQQADLLKLMPVLQRSSLSSQVTQAAVWMITDNADYTALGRLVTFPRAPVGATVTQIRSIGPAEAARAMQLLDEAGINLAARAIWRDRVTIVNGLADGPLKTWLRQRAGL